MLLMDLNVIDSLSMTCQGKAFTCLKVPDLDRGISRTTSQESTVEMEMIDTIGVPFECTDALARVVVPYPQCVVRRTCNKFGIIKLKSANRSRVSLELSKDLSGFQVPDGDCLVLRSSDQRIVGFGQLQTGD